MTAKTYSPKKISVTVAGADITGFTDGTYVSVARNMDTFTPHIGAGGDTTRIRNSDNSGTITITLDQTADSNAVLSSLQIADEQTSAGQFPILIKDNNGTSVYGAESAWIQKPADADFAGDSVSPREWIIYCAVLTTFNGTNNT